MNHVTTFFLYYVLDNLLQANLLSGKNTLLFYLKIIEHKERNTNNNYNIII